MLYIILGIVAIVILAITIYHIVMYPKPLISGKGNIRIACIGDSITYSLGVLGKRKKYSYPSLLSKKLGSSYQVVNYGLNDRTLLSTGDKPYFQEKVGQLAWNCKENIIIFMLGTNDCKRKNWNEKQFEIELENIIQHYIFEMKKQFILMIPPKIFYKKVTKNGYDNSLLEKELIPIINNLKEKYHIPCIDLFEKTKDHPKWFFDRLHPNKIGNVAISEFVFDEIKEILQKC